MRIRPNVYYAVICDRNGNIERVEIDSTDPKELLYLVCECLPERMNPPRGDDGKCKKGIPYTKLKVVEFNKATRTNRTLTYGHIYNLSPAQIIERITKNI